MATTNHTVSIKLHPDTKARLRHLAQNKRRTAHWIMREAIQEYLDREEKKEAFRQDTIKAWEEYRSTGLHVTAEEVDTWMASWGTDQELPAPQCHE
ncbi:CopG family ribbon-helix-helix protein [Acidithiobacillus caldus]|uniref:CopG family ribbon-helix-helix protein n=1 Tax=Acidithiobacillus caldus TaxID=33059 RepID=UPI000871D92B|nr:CopG family ribbon-helix-helix protein [Acidithiobacillus caldus]OFC38238.1 CopG family transcriptional regulator [Acidithiobacillus caldus]OFC41733.1 CopG family transcriptional regulator [Acidithiobacillus caldus]